MKQEPFELFRAWIDSNHCCCCNKFIILNYYFLLLSRAHSCLFNAFFLFFYFPPPYIQQRLTNFHRCDFCQISPPTHPNTLLLGGDLFSWNILSTPDLSNSWWLAWAKEQERPFQRKELPLFNSALCSEARIFF